MWLVVTVDGGDLELKNKKNKKTGARLSCQEKKKTMEFYFSTVRKWTSLTVQHPLQLFSSSELFSGPDNYISMCLQHITTQKALRDPSPNGPL